MMIVQINQFLIVVVGVFKLSSSSSFNMSGDTFLKYTSDFSDLNYKTKEYLHYACNNTLNLEIFYN